MVTILVHWQVSTPWGEFLWIDIHLNSPDGLQYTPFSSPNVQSDVSKHLMTSQSADTPGVWCAVSGAMEYDWKQKYDGTSTWRLDCNPCTVICNQHVGLCQPRQVCHALEIRWVLQTEFTQVNILHMCDFFLSLRAVEFAGQSKFAWHASSRAGTEALPKWHPHLLCCYPNSQPVVILWKQLCTFYLKARFSWLGTCHWAHIWVPNSCPPRHLIWRVSINSHFW